MPPLPSQMIVLIIRVRRRDSPQAERVDHSRWPILGVYEKGPALHLNGAERSALQDHHESLSDPLACTASCARWQLCYAGAQICCFSTRRSAAPTRNWLQFEAISRLDRDEKKVVKSVLDSILIKHDVKRWLSE